MTHPSGATLDRIVSDTTALQSERRHVAGCMQCLRVLRERHPEFASKNAAALALRGPAGARTARAWYVLAATVALVLIITTPLRSLAQNFLAIFEPRQFVAVPLTRADFQTLRALPNLEAYGTMRVLVKSETAEARGAADASRLARMPVRVPAYVPASLGPATYAVVSRSVGAFTFSAAKAARTAAKLHSILPPMPARLDGSTLQAVVGPLVVADYRLPQLQRAVNVPSDRHTTAFRVARLVVAQMPVPVVISNGVAASTLIAYLAEQPGIPPQLAAELRSIADPASTLPIPIPIDRLTATPVLVQGVRGLGVGDNTGVGAGIIWQRDGIVYGVAGALSAQTILAVADSLR